MSIRALFAIVASALLATPGCGPPKANVAGTVSCQGKLLAMGTVYIVGSDGVALPSQINSDGTYRVDGVAAGKVRIGVSSPKPTSPEFAARAFKGREPPQSGAGSDLAKWIEIPEKYSDPFASPLIVELKPGPNNYDIELP